MMIMMNTGINSN